MSALTDLACNVTQQRYNPPPFKKHRLYNMLRSKIAPFAGVFALVAVLSALLSGCSGENQAPEPGPSEPDLAALEQRVEARWKHMVAKEFAETWQYETPNYRKNFPKSLYLGNFSYAVDWRLTGIDVVNYDADAAVASVAVRVMSEPAKRTSTASAELGAVPITFHEKWIFIDGEWWHSANK